MQACLNYFDSATRYCICASSDLPPTNSRNIEHGWNLIYHNCALPLLKSSDKVQGIVGLALVATAVITAAAPLCRSKVDRNTTKNHFILALAFGAVGITYLIKSGIALQDAIDTCCKEKYREYDLLTQA